MSLQIQLGPGMSVELAVRQDGADFRLSAMAYSQWAGGGVTASIDLEFPPGLQEPNMTGVHTAFMVGPGPGLFVRNVLSRSLGELNSRLAQRSMSEPITGTITVGTQVAPIRTTWSKLSE
jgi:hypothetical protein